MPQTDHTTKTIKYGFVKPNLIRAFRVIDRVGKAVIMPFLPQIKAADFKPSRILLVNLAHIGDLLLTTPAIHALRSKFPAANITALVAPWSKDVIKHNPHINNIITYNASWWDRSRGNPYFVLPEYINLVKIIRQGKFDCIINFKSFFQENLLGAMAGIPCRIGYGIYGGDFLQSSCIDYYPQHTVLQHLELISALDVTFSDPCVEIFTSYEDEKFADECLIQIQNKPFVSMHIGAGAPAKIWHWHKFAQLAVLIHKRYGFATVFLGGKEDLEYIHKAVKILQHPYCITAGITNITQSAAILRRAKLFIGNDSGPAHLASAVNVPVIVLFSGVNLSEMWRPWGKNVFVIQNKPSCYLCGLKECNQPKHICMDNITVEDVIEKAQLVIG